MPHLLLKARDATVVVGEEGVASGVFAALAQDAFDHDLLQPSEQGGFLESG